MLSSKQLDYHNLTGYTLDLSTNLFTDEALAVLADRLQDIDRLGISKQETLELKMVEYFKSADLMLKASKELGYKNMCSILNISQSTLSHHLMVLRTFNKFYLPLLQLKIKELQDDRI